MSRDRDAAPNIGAQFSLAEDGTEMFAFVIDGGSTIGPRKATDEDREKHADAYEAFLNNATAPGGAAAPKRGRAKKG